MATDPTQIPSSVPYTSPLFTDTVVPLMIGVYLSFTLFGIGLLQFYHCFRLLAQSTEKETVNFILLSFLLLLDIGDQAVKAIFFVDNQRGVAVHGLAAAYLPSPKSTAALVIFGAFIPFCTHIYYIQRIHRISRNWTYRYIVWVVLVLCLLAGFMTLVFAALSARIGLRPAIQYFPDIKTYPVPWLGGEAAIDIILCATLSFYLYSQRTDFSHTNDLLTKWINITVETGLFPAVVALTDLCLGIRYPEKTYHFAANLIVTKAYVNSVLVLFSNIQQARIKDMNAASHVSSGSRPGPKYIGSNFIPGNPVASGVLVRSQIETAKEPHDLPHQVVNLQRNRDEFDYTEKYPSYGVDLEKGNNRP
ncbi:hypothetical protein BT69DRAFT_1317995 [Atractiella rhizophila]|nr:hypothetical protein BT69DRAFT_1317995 [Atractiella rhizophila]